MRPEDMPNKHDRETNAPAMQFVVPESQDKTAQSHEPNPNIHERQPSASQVAAGPQGQASNSDVIALQETWLPPHDIPCLGSIDDSFAYTGKSAVDTSAGILRGRPYGGVALLWKKDVFPIATVIEYTHKDVKRCKSAESDVAVRFTNKQVKNVIRGMVKGKSPGHDGLSIEHLKSGDASDISNYRPISLATIVAKVLDSLLDQHLNKHINLHDQQFGFRTGLSTESAIMCLKETVQYYVTRKTPVYACFLDLSRAFDLVSYRKLWEKLEDETFCNQEVVSLLKHWYNNQTNVVKWAGASSAVYRLNFGVRQGGLTSPRLFNLYMNGLIGELNSTGVGCHIDGNNDH
ncbi:uncharacterized protein LOC113507447 [Trichoplusia ni]|uniref:Uncharacterized protein LOC113507447 n=1 Tax=Trichoplusia ni TaxID=7111 RepID=A0A7E5X0U9_TRINI|nr:uncharacterized protein LOC113507447 [Trichoplusia ni]